MGVWSKQAPDGQREWPATVCAPTVRADKARVIAHWRLALSLSLSLSSKEKTAAANQLEKEPLQLHALPKERKVV